MSGSGGIQSEQFGLEGGAELEMPPKRMFLIRRKLLTPPQDWCGCFNIRHNPASQSSAEPGLPSQRGN